LTIRDGVARLRLSPDPRQLDQLEAFESLVREHGARLGLVSPGDLASLRSRHLLDSLRAVHAFVGDERRACDLGSGAGFPGVPLAILLPHVPFVLCEPQQRRAGFLELVAEHLGLENVEVFAGRVEALAERAFDLCTARAFGPLDRSWRAAFPVLSPGGRLVYFAGRSLRDPEGAGRSLSDPEPPATVSALEVLANVPPLVIMAREVNSYGDP
jgi:16S rRNA (guanine527-N7)-methyltransferase